MINSESPLVLMWSSLDKAVVSMTLAVLFLVAATGGSVQTVRAQDTGVAISVQASTLGPSAGVHFEATEALHIRLRGSYLPYSYEREIEDDVTADATADLTLGGPEARFEWHPFESAFHLTAGALYNLTEVDASVVPTSAYEYNEEKTFSPDKVGSLEGTVSYSSVAPYAGIGLGDALDSRWSFMVELGTYYTGSPEVTMEGEGLIKPTEQNAEILEDGLESFQFLPHVAFGLAFQL